MNPPPIQHRCFDYKYTKSVSMDQCTLRYQSQMTPQSNCNKSCTLYTALHSIQLYICCHFIYLVIWSWAIGQVSHAFISIEHFCQFTCDCIMLLLLLLLLLLLCITQQQQGQLQDSYKLIMKSLLSKIKRPIVKQISFTPTCSEIADLYIYMKRCIVHKIHITDTCSAIIDLYIYRLINM